MSSESGFVNVLNTKFYYEMCGEGPAVVFLHGNPVDLNMWDYQVEEFSKHFTVLRFDFRGFGRSENPGPKGYSHADDLKALLDYFGIKRANIVGLSMGGGAAVNFAILYPEMTAAAVFADSSLGGFNYSKQLTDSFSMIPELAREKGLDAVRKMTLSWPIFNYAKIIEPVNKLLIEMVNRYQGWHWLNRDTGKPLKPPAIERLGEIKAPSLVIVGEYDTQDFHDIADILAGKIPNSKKIVMKGIGHIVNMEAPDRFNEIVLEFLKKI